MRGRLFKGLCVALMAFSAAMVAGDVHGGQYPWEPPDPGAPAYEYLYYPGQSVYFDTARELYFFPMDEGWVKAPTLPADVRKELGEFVILRMSTYKPYLYHSQVREAYSGKSPRRAPATPKPPRKASESDSSYKVMTNTTSVPLTYWYYPAAFTYYDPRREVYYYRTDGQWIQSPRLPQEIGQHKGDPVMLQIDADPPILRHAQVVEKHPHPGYDVNVQEFIEIKRVYKK